jgi:hypothetical protein
MATSSYFNNFAASGEQNLLEDLIIEAIRIYGEDMYYIPRKLTNFDKLYTEDDQSVYEQAFLIEMYIKSVDGFTGDGNFMSKFGVEIQDQVTFSVAQRIFNQEIGVITGQSRPNEGDLIYFPLNKKCFQIRYTNKFEMFYQLGGLQTWEMTCELFSYSNETINTGIAEIDVLQKNFSTNILDYALKDELGNPLSNENDDILVTEKYVLENIDPGADNSTIQQGSNNFPSGSDSFIDFSDENPFTEGDI